MKQIIEQFFKAEDIKYDFCSISRFIAYRLFSSDDLLAVISFLKSHPEIRMGLLIDLFGADFPHKTQRFEVSYSFLSLLRNQRFLFKLNLDENDQLNSISSVFINASWYERELFDMFGIHFNIKMDRILTDYGFKGFPLRKDFPLSGNLEIKYDKKIEKIIHQPVQLDQEFRDFDFESVWEGPSYDKNDGQNRK